MLVFCPNCSNLLYVAYASNAPGYPEGGNALTCRTCPYQYMISTPIYDRTKMTPKVAEDIIGADDAFKNAERIDIKCKNDDCDNTDIVYTQAQIRSADEPMTTFYKCPVCKTNWRD